MDKKFGSKIGTGHHTHAVGSPHRTKSSSSLNGFTGTNLSIEIVEVRESSEKKMPLVGGPYLCVFEVADPTIHQTVWKQRSSAQFTNKPPIIFGDVFKVKNFSGEWGVDIKPGFTLKVQFCKMQDKAPTPLDSQTIALEDLVVNKEQQKIISLEEGKAEVVLRLTLSNTQYPRGNTLTLNEIGIKEKEKEKANEQPDKEKPSLERTLSSYSLPRVTTRFVIHYHTVIGEDVRVVGSNYKLGDWDAFKAPTMDWHHGDIWVLEINFRKVFVPFEYKYAVVNTHHNTIRWETFTANRKVELVEEESIVKNDTWDKL